MFLIEWILEVFKELHRFYVENLSSGGPVGRMQRQLRLLYGRGEIDKITFHKLRNYLSKGYSIEAEIKMSHRQSIARLEAKGMFADQHSNSEIARSLDQLYINRAILEEVRLEMRYALQVIETTSQWLQKQVEITYKNAQSALPHEEAARGFLEIRHDLMERVQYLNNRTQAIHKNLQQIDMLEAELGVYEAELILVEAQEHFVASRPAFYH